MLDFVFSADILRAWLIKKTKHEGKRMTAIGRETWGRKSFDTRNKEFLQHLLIDCEHKPRRLQHWLEDNYSRSTKARAIRIRTMTKEINKKRPTPKVVRKKQWVE